MALFSIDSMYLNDWHNWQAEDIQRTFLDATAERYHNYYLRYILPKKMKKQDER